MKVKGPYPIEQLNRKVAETIEKDYRKHGKKGHWVYERNCQCKNPDCDSKNLLLYRREGDDKVVFYITGIVASLKGGKYFSSFVYRDADNSIAYENVDTNKKRDKLGLYSNVWDLLLLSPSFSGEFEHLKPSPKTFMQLFVTGCEMESTYLTNQGNLVQDVIEVEPIYRDIVNNSANTPFLDFIYDVMDYRELHPDEEFMVWKNISNRTMELTFGPYTFPNATEYVLYFIPLLANFNVSRTYSLWSRYLAMARQPDPIPSNL